MESSTREWNLICNNTINVSREWLITCATADPSCSIWNMTCNSTDLFQTVLLSTTPVGREWDLTTNEIRMYFQIINFVFICEIIDLFGTGTNIINIICFVKQGFNDPVNISFLGLTITDLLSLITLVWHNISVNPLLYETDIPFDPEQTVYLTAGTPHLAFTRITGWITAFITLERCLCITHPLKVRNFFTKKRVICILTIISVVIISSNFSIAYYTIPFEIQPHPYLNRSWIGLGFTFYRRPIERYAFGINSILVPFSAFAVVVISTVILVVKLTKNTKWRKKTTSMKQSDGMSNRDRSVSKMVVSISTIFIICYIPVCIIHIAMIIEPKFSIDGTFANAFAIVFSFAYILESINASINIFVYYKASSRYRVAFRQIFCMDQKRGNAKAIKETSTTNNLLSKLCIIKEEQI